MNKYGGGGELSDLDNIYYQFNTKPKEWNLPKHIFDSRFLNKTSFDVGTRNSINHTRNHTSISVADYYDHLEIPPSSLLYDFSGSRYGNTNSSENDVSYVLVSGLAYHVFQLMLDELQNVKIKSIEKDSPDKKVF